MSTSRRRRRRLRLLVRIDEQASLRASSPPPPPRPSAARFRGRASPSDGLDAVVKIGTPLPSRSCRHRPPGEAPCRLAGASRPSRRSSSLVRIGRPKGCRRLGGDEAVSHITRDNHAVQVWLRAAKPRQPCTGAGYSQAAACEKFVAAHKCHASDGSLVRIDGRTAWCALVIPLRRDYVRSTERASCCVSTTPSALLEPPFNMNPAARAKPCLGHAFRTMESTT